MGIPQSIRDRYGRDQQALLSLHEYVRTTLTRWCSERGYALDGRVKTLESVAEKLETGRYRKWSELDDLVAFTIVVPTTAHEEKVGVKLAAVFQEVLVRGRGTTRKAPEVFRFDATRWYGHVRRDRELPLETRATQAIFEVQIKTAFENAWSAVTHDLVYKGQAPGWRQKRLAAQLKAMVEQIDFLLNQFESAAEGIQASSDPASDSQTLIATTFKELIGDGTLSDSLLPDSWQRFAECVFELARRPVRNDREAADKVSELCEGFTQAVRRGDLQPAGSGSLFQCVVAYLVGENGVQAIERFPIAASGEFVSFYGIDSLPLEIDLEA